MKRPDYRTLQALDAVIRERGFERAAQKLCITQSAVSQRIKQLENMFGQPLLVRTVPPRPTEQGQKLLALLRQVEPGGASVSVEVDDRGVVGTTGIVVRPVHLGLVGSPVPGGDQLRLQLVGLTSTLGGSLRQHIARFPDAVSQVGERALAFSHLVVFVEILQ